MIPKKSTIKNLRYRQFLDSGMIEPINETDIRRVLDNIKSFRKVTRSMARSFVIILYYTGARPNELLQLDTAQFAKDGHFLTVKVPGSKRGLPRKIYLPLKLPLVQELHNYAFSLPPGYRLFYALANKSIRQDGAKVNIRTTDKLRYYFKQWFSVLTPGGVPPYFLRHSRFSKMAEAGEDLQTLRFMKGSRTFDSVMPYLHLTKKTALKAARKLE